MIRDLRELRERGQVLRRMWDLTIPVEQWRANVRRFSRCEGFRVRTGVIDLFELSGPVTRMVRRVRVVWAIRVGAPDAHGRARRRPSKLDPPPAPVGVAARARTTGTRSGPADRRLPATGCDR